MDIRKLQRVIVDGLEDVKAQDIVVFNTEHLSPLFERVIIASGTSNRQTKALASSVRKAVKEEGFQVMRTEGEDNGEWIIVDCAAAVVHIMQPAIRQYYQLEEIWGDKPVAIKLKAAKTSLVKASEPEEDEAPVKPKKASGKVTAAKKAATTAPTNAPTKKVAAKKVAAKKAVAVKKSTSVVSVKEMMAGQLTAMTGNTAPAGGNKIRVTQDKQFILPDAPRRGIVVNYGDLRLYYFPKQGPVQTYAIGVGRDGFELKFGQTKIVRKKEKPTWYPTESVLRDKPWVGTVVPPGADARAALRREVKDETDLDVVVEREVGRYAGVDRDPRGRVVATAYLCRLARAGQVLRCREDAGEARFVAADELRGEDLAFDHEDMLVDAARLIAG